MVAKQFSQYWCLDFISLHEVKSAVPRRVQISVEIGSWRFFALLIFNTITGEWFIYIIKEQLERKMVTAFKGQAHFCFVLDFVRSEGLLNRDNCLPSAIVFLTIITFQQDLGYKLKGKCKIFHKLTWVLKIQLDTLLWLCLHSFWNVCSVKGFQLLM